MAMRRGFLVVEAVGMVDFGGFVRYCGRRGLDGNFLGHKISIVRGVSGDKNERGKDLVLLFYAPRPILLFSYIKFKTYYRMFELNR